MVKVFYSVGCVLLTDRPFAEILEIFEIQAIEWLKCSGDGDGDGIGSSDDGGNRCQHTNITLYANISLCANHCSV